MSLSLGLAIGALVLLSPILWRGIKKFKEYLKAQLAASLPDYLDLFSDKLLELVFTEAEDAISKVLNKAAELSKDGKLDDADRKVLLALLKEETVGELDRQIDKLKKSVL